MVDRTQEDTSHRFFGAWVALADEIDPARGYISMDAPLARLLLKKQVGDEVTVDRPDKGELWLEVVAIEYE